MCTVGGTWKSTTEESAVTDSVTHLELAVTK